MDHGRLLSLTASLDFCSIESSPSTHSISSMKLENPKSDNEATEKQHAESQSAIGLAGAKSSKRRKALLALIDKLVHLG